MGGGSSGGQPTDLLGGQFASFSGGTPPSTFDYSGLGKAFSSAGSQYAQGAAAGANQNYMTGSTIPAQQNYGGANLPPTLIPSVQDLKKENKDDLAEALQRLMASGAESAKLRQAWYWQFRTKGVPTELLQPDFTPYMGLV